MGPGTGAFVSMLAKLGGGVATGQLKRLLADKTLRRRVARNAAKAAKKRKIQITRGSIRNWLARSQDQLAVGSAIEVESALQYLAWLLPQKGPQPPDRAAKELLNIILREYQVAQSPQNATALGTEWTQERIRTESQQTRSLIQSESRAIIDVVTGPDVFDQDLTVLHPWRSAEARGLQESWRPLAGLVHLLVSSGTRAETLRQWADQTPEDLVPAPADVWCWFGVLAADYGAWDAANSYFQRGIEKGAAPSNYWWARSALNSANRGAPEETIREIANRSQPPHPLATAQLLLLDEQYIECSEVLRDWEPDGPNDRAIKAILLAKCLFGQEDMNGAIAVSLDAAKMDPDSSGVMLVASEALLSRGHYGSSDHPLADFAHARELAIRVRDSRRKWSGDSVVAILTAIKASVLSTDLDRAWRLTQAPPDGEATDSERKDPRLRREAAILAAMMGNFDTAQSLAAEFRDPYTTATVNAWMALDANDLQGAQDEWINAWNSAPGNFAKLATAATLAPLGLKMPDLTEIESDHPESVRRIRTIHEVMAGAEDKLSMLRARAPESEQLTVLLAQLLVGQDDHEGAARVLEEGANRFTAPLLMRMSATRYFHAGLYRDAVRACESALTLAGREWAGELETLMVQFEALEAQDLQTESLAIARRMVGLAPDNLDIRWALVHCLVRRGELADAWAALNYNGEPVQPRGVYDAQNWIALLALYDKSPLFVNRALAVMRGWTDNIELSGIFLAQIYSGLNRNDVQVHDSDLKALHAATAEYTAKHPDSTTFRAISVGTTGDPLEAISQELRDNANDEKLRDLLRKVERAELPLGIVSSVLPRSYTETAIKRASGFVYSHDLASESRVADSVLESLGRPVVLDSTAAVALALLDSTLANLTIGSFSSVLSTDQAYRDALAARDVLEMKSTLSVGWNDRLQRAVPYTITDDEAERLASHAAHVVEILTRCNRRGWPGLKVFPKLDADAGWLNAIDYAVSSKIGFWCDDAVLRQLAISQGGATFGTVDILRTLSERGIIAPEILEVAEATLIANYHVDLGFDPDVFRLAAQYDGWRAGGAAAALSRAQTWSEPEGTLQFLYEALAANAAASPIEVQSWTRSAAGGVLKLAHGDIDAMTLNLRVLLGRLVNQPWMGPDVLPYVVAAIRAAKEQEGAAADDPLNAVFSGMFANLAKAHGPSIASQILLVTARQLEPADRDTIARVILTS